MKAIIFLIFIFFASSSFADTYGSIARCTDNSDQQTLDILKEINSNKGLIVTSIEDLDGRFYFSENIIIEEIIPAREYKIMTVAGTSMHAYGFGEIIINDSGSNWTGAYRSYDCFLLN